MSSVIDFAAARDRIRAPHRRALILALAAAWDAAVVPSGTPQADPYGWFSSLPTMAGDGELHRRGDYLRLTDRGDTAELDFSSSDVHTSWTENVA